MNTESERWAKLEDNMVTRSMIRSKSQCQEKWETLASDFKKQIIIKRRYDRDKKHIFKWKIWREEITSQ